MRCAVLILLLASCSAGGGGSDLPRTVAELRKLSGKGVVTPTEVDGSQETEVPGHLRAVPGSTTDAMADGSEIHLPDHGDASADPNLCPGVGGACEDSAPSRCSPGCEERGTCNQQLGRCDCLRGMFGESCEIGSYEPFEGDGGKPENDFCHGACNERGICMGGFCHCKPGFFGADCSTYLDQSGKPRLVDAQWRGNRPTPKVYVYPLPPKYNAHLELFRLDRKAEPMMYERLLSSHHRVADGDEADLFLIPVSTRSSFRDKSRNGIDLNELFEYINITWPQWSTRNQWRDHLMFFTDDWGPCDAYPKLAERNPPPALQNIIVITFWGLKDDDERYQGGGPCFFPRKDVLIPPINSLNHYDLSPYHPDGLASDDDGTLPLVNYHVKNRNASLIPSFSEAVGSEEFPVRRWLLYFAGNAKIEQSGYTVRREALRLFAGRESEGLRLLQRDENYEQNMAAATFCLGPTGAGWGRRVNLAMQFGCIPVIVQDNITQPYEDLLPYDNFAIRIPESEMESLPEMLRSIPDSCDGLPPGSRCLQRMRRELTCATRATMWSSGLGSAFGEGGEDDAFALLMLSLQHRLATYVNPIGRKQPAWTPEFPLKDACDAPRALSCLRSVTTPICRAPCTKKMQRQQHNSFPAGGAVCGENDDVPEGKHTCD
jgi:hypothetical protein